MFGVDGGIHSKNKGNNYGVDTSINPITMILLVNNKQDLKVSNEKEMSLHYDFKGKKCKKMYPDRQVYI